MRINKLDIDRLHSSDTSRGSGNTFRLLANVFGNMEFGDEILHVIVIPSGRPFTYLKKEIIKFARLYGEPIDWVNGLDIKFSSGKKIRLAHDDLRLEEVLNGYIYRIFYD